MTVLVSTPAAAATRATWPAILLLEDLALVLGARTSSGARRIVLRAGIPFGWLGRRMFVRREALAEWFASQETAATPAPAPVREPPEWATRILRRRGGETSPVDAGSQV